MIKKRINSTKTWWLLSLAALLIFAAGLTVAAPHYPHSATVHGKYYGLKQVIHCPRDHHKYGNFKDYGYWGGGHWCGRHGKRGYWVWVYPNWYVWSHRH